MGRGRGGGRGGRGRGGGGEGGGGRGGGGGGGFSDQYGEASMSQDREEHFGFGGRGGASGGRMGGGGDAGAPLWLPSADPLFQHRHAPGWHALAACMAAQQRPKLTCSRTPR